MDLNSVQLRRFPHRTRTRFRTLIRQYPPGDPEQSLAPLDVGDRGSAAVALAGVGARPVEVAGAEHPPGEAVRPVNLEDRKLNIANQTGFIGHNHLNLLN